MIRYPGGKAKLRDVIVSRIRADGLEYREPFFGGGGIGLRWLCDHQTAAWINDKDIGIACLWTAVIQEPEVLKSHVRAFQPSVVAFHSIKKELLEMTAMPTNVTETGFKKLAIHQISYSGLGTKSGGPLGGEQQASRYKVDCRWSPGYICKKIDKVHEQLAQVDLRSSCCTNQDFSDLILDETKKAFLYLDPPYYVKGNDIYQHGFSQEDHQRLATQLKNTPHAWLLSYDDCPEVRELYSWAKVEVIDVNYSITALKDKETGKRSSRTKGELLIS